MIRALLLSRLSVEDVEAYNSAVIANTIDNSGIDNSVDVGIKKKKKRFADEKTITKLALRLDPIACAAIGVTKRDLEQIEVTITNYY